MTLNGSEKQEVSLVVLNVRGPVDLHLILEVTDAGTPAMTSYRRAVVSVAE